ncbi:SDR family NAD(P)-dependent oxidoreductase, partial [Candidatus Gracilibacteria bacterium]|nr:SDR family NAD(P)-dependent oxidoreductase [Candidatus Gracilibacteria bacterium]
HTLLPLLTAGAGVLFMRSVGRALPVPRYAVYGASKAALAGFARSLRVELAENSGFTIKKSGRQVRQKPIAVQVIHPGATRTAMHTKSGMPLEAANWQRFSPPERVAKQIVDASAGDKPVTTIGIGNRLLHSASRYVGGALDRIGVRIEAQQTGAPSPSTPNFTPSSTTVRHCTITGGADGIGRAVAERYARAGWVVTLIDRDSARAEALCHAITNASGVAHSIVADLAEPEGVAAVLQQLAALPPIDIFVNSAGISAVGRFATLPFAQQQHVLDINLRAPLQLTAGLLQRELLAPQATLVFIASLSVFTSYPGAAAYAASKDGLAAYARSLRVALARSHINVLTVFPGPTRTAHARRYSPDNRRETQRMPPAHLAELLYAAVERRSGVLVPGAANRLIATIGRIAPAFTEYLMRKTILDKLPPGDIPVVSIEGQSIGSLLSEPDPLAWLWPPR